MIPTNTGVGSCAAAIATWLKKRCLADFTHELNTNTAAKKIQHSRRTHSKKYFLRNMGYKSSGFSDPFIYSSWAWYKNMPHKAEFKAVQGLLLFCYPAVWCWHELPTAEALWVLPAHRESMHCSFLSSLMTLFLRVLHRLIPKYSQCLLTFQSTVIRTCTSTSSCWNRNPKTDRENKEMKRLKIPP